jgi:ATP-dependent RNA helicase RhlE
VSCPLLLPTTKVIVLTTFESLGLSAPILKAVAAEGYETPTPIQAQAIPHLLAGRDLLGIAQTGTGKTAAFALPMLEMLARDGRRAERGTARALILAPTRELSSQILDSFKTYGKNLKLSRTVVFGGVSLGKQIEAVRNGVDILVATPGRLVDLIERKALSLSKVEIFVLDEVDQMLDLGFIHAIRKITGLLPKVRQNLFFSATMPKEIAGLAANLLKDPARVEITPVATTAERVVQSVIHVDPANKAKLLTALLQDPQITRALVFTRTKHGADKVVKVLTQAKLEAAAIHGNKSQANRERALAGFKSGKVLALVATDIAARGIDVDGVSHVFNYDLPFVPESYVHRIGRTARAGAAGEAIAFCTPEDRGLLRDIERTIRQTVPMKEHELGIQGVTELAPNHGWDPTARRKSGGGRHMPKAAKKPHRGQGGKPAQPRGEQPKREWTPVGMPTQAIDQSQFAKPAAPQRKPEGERLRHERPHAERAPGDRKPSAHSPSAHTHGERKHKPAGRPQGERTFAGHSAGGKPSRGGPAKGGKPHGGNRNAGGRSDRGAAPSGNAGSWMKSIGRGNAP